MLTLRNNALARASRSAGWRLLATLALAAAVVAGLMVVPATAATDRTPPSAPSGLSARYYGGVGVQLSWRKSSSSDVDHYNVYRGSGSSVSVSAASRIATTSALSSSDAMLASGAKAAYAVTAVDKAGNESKPSSKAGVTAKDTSAPSAPSSLRASASSAGITLSWKISPAPDLSGFAIYRSDRSSRPATPLATVGPTVSSWVDASAPAGTKTYYWVTAQDLTGNRSSAVSVTATRPAGTAPAPAPAPVPTSVPSTPSSGKATISSGVVTISWGAAKGATGYVVCKRLGDKDASRTYQVWNPVTGQPTGTGECTKTFAPASSDLVTATSFVDRSVTEGVTAYYRIYAWNAKGLSGYAAITATNPMVAPPQVTEVKVAQAGGPAAHGLVITWSASRATDLAGYTVSRASSSSGTFAVIGTVAAGTTTFADTSAPQGAPSYYRVTATDLVGNVSKPSSTVSGTSTTAPAPLAVAYKELSVDPSGAGGAFRTIGAALATVPSSNVSPVRITIAPGTYHESFEITSPYVTLRGATGNPQDVVIDDDKAAGAIDPATGQPYGTADSYTVFVNAPEVTFTGLTVRNSFDEAASTLDKEQAVALRVEGNHFVADHVRLLGNQDTLLADTPKPTTRIRQYYANSYIEGDVDYVFGAATAVFENDVFHSLDRGKSDNGAITAASTDSGNKYGFLIENSKVISDAAPGTVHLGRPWHPSADPNAVAQVTWRNTWLPAAIAAAQPWEDMASTDSSGNKVNFTWQSARFSEYANTGPGATTNANRPQLSDKDAANYTPTKYLAGSDGWNPTVAHPADLLPAPAAPTGLVASGDLHSVHLAWDDTTSADVVGWTVQRTGSDGATTTVATVDSPVYTDSTVTPGATYSYSVAALNRSKVSSPPSAPVTVTAVAAPLVSDLTVDPQATPDATHFRTIGDALAAAKPGTAANPTVITIAKGTYSEYLTVATPGVVLLGATGNPADVVITGDRAAGTPLPDGSGTYGTSGSATVAITANDVQFHDLTVQNAYKEGTYANGQAVALRTTGDRLVFDDVRLLGNQDTLYVNSASATVPARSYFYDSYIEGDVDFIFGRGTAVFDRSTLFALDHGTSPNGAVTAASTDQSVAHGILITSSKITGTAPNGSQNLGRPWQPGVTQADGTSTRNTAASAQVVVRNSWLGPVVSTTQPWTSMVNSGYTTTPQEARFAEYQNAGPGAVSGSGVYRPQLSAADAANDTAEGYLAGSDGWNPVRPQAADVAPQAVAGLTAAGDDRSVTLSWTESAEPDVVGYRIYRATGTGAPSLDDADLLTAASSAGLTDTSVSNGTTYTYSVVAVDAAGNVSAPNSATVTPAPAPLKIAATVAADGSGDYTSVGAALAALPDGTPGHLTVVSVKPGTYREVVSSSRKYLTIVGASGNPSDAVITFDNANGTAKGASTCPTVTTATCGTAGSATVTLTGTNVTVKDLTIENAFDSSAHPEVGSYNTQAVALRATGDRQVYQDVRLLGVQDTLNADASGNISADGSGYPRQYFVDSFIQGSVDYVFGRATAVFDHVTFSSTQHSGGTIFAPSTASKAKGYLVTGSRVVSANDPGSFYLGRPWRAWTDGTYADNSRGQTVVRDTWIAGGINTSHPWTDFAPNTWSDGRWAEYHNSGPGAVSSPDRPTLSDSDAAVATPAAWLAGSDGWNPGVDHATVADTAPAAPVVTAAAGDGTVTLSWPESPEADVVGYRVYRVDNGRSTLLTTSLLTSAGYTVKGLANGTPVAFEVTAVDAGGNESAPSATVTVTPQTRYDAVVAADGTGSFTTLQAAVDAAPQSGPWQILVQPGTYTGTTTIAKSGITVVGAGNDPSAVVLTNGTATPTVTITGGSVTLRGLRIANTATGTAPAVSMTGDKVVLQADDVRSAGARAVFADVVTAGATSHQMIDASTVTGTSDLLFGRATLAVHASTLVPTASSQPLTTPSTTADGGHGFLITDSTIAPAQGVTDIRFARPYNQSPIDGKNNPELVIRNTALPAGIKSAPWMDFSNGSATTSWTQGRFAEYANTGLGAVMAETSTRPQLSSQDSVGYTVNAWLGGGDWYPVVTDPAAPGDTTPPVAPATPTVSTTGTSATLSWAPNTEADLAGYRLYRSTSSPVALSLGNRVGGALITGTTFTDTGLTSGGTYQYALVAVDQAGNVSPASTISATAVDTQAPATPTGVSALGGDGRVTLSWTASPDADVAGYRVYTADGTQVTTSPVTGTSYTVSGLTNGTTYGYAVSAVDTAGNESQRSAVASATPQAGDNTAPAVPAGVNTVLGKSSVILSWTPVGDSDVAGYTVYRSTSGGTPVRLTQALVTGTSYTDSSGSVGTAYIYTVTASDASGNESAASTGAAATPVAADLVVAADGTGDFTTVQAAVDSLANNASFSPSKVILVKPGTYPGFSAALQGDGVTKGNRYGVSIVGASSNPADTVLTAAGGATATVTLAGDRWSLSNITVASVASAAGSQATALQVKSGDKDVFTNVRFLGDKQTLQVSTANVTTFSRLYFRNAYVEGGADMVLGRAVTVFDHSTFHVLNRPGASLTDSSVDASWQYGFLITDSTILTDGNPGSIFLGRPYGTNGKAQVVVRNTSLGSAINTAPWTNWDTTTTWTAGRFFEYQNTGSGAVITDPTMRPQLSDADAAAYTAQKYLAGTDGWNPTA